MPLHSDAVPNKNVFTFSTEVFMFHTHDGFGSILIFVDGDDAVGVHTENETDEQQTEAQPQQDGAPRLVCPAQQTIKHDDIRVTQRHTSINSIVSVAPWSRHKTGLGGLGFNPHAL